MEEAKMNGEGQPQTNSAPREGGGAKSVISINKKNVTITSTGKDRSRMSKVTTTPLRSNQDPSLAGASHVSTRIKDTQFMSALSQKFHGNGSVSASPVPDSPRALASTPSSRSSHSRSSSSSSTSGADLSSKLSSMLLQQQQQQQQQQQHQQQKRQTFETTSESSAASEESSSVPPSPSSPTVKVNGHALSHQDTEGGDSGSDASSTDLVSPPPPPPPSALMRSISERPPLRKVDASYTPRPKSYSTQSSAHGSGATTPTGSSHHHHKHDLMAALTAVVTSGSPSASLRKTRGPGKAGGVTEVFTAKKSPEGSSAAGNGSDKQAPPSPVTEDFDPKNFLEQVPRTDRGGNTIPDWKRMMMAKTIAQKAQEEYLEKKKTEDYEARFKDMPDWKRALIEKKESGTNAN